MTTIIEYLVGPTGHNYPSHWASFFGNHVICSCGLTSWSNGCWILWLLCDQNSFGTLNRWLIAQFWRHFCRRKRSKGRRKYYDVIEQFSRPEEGKTSNSQIRKTRNRTVREDFNAKWYYIPKEYKPCHSTLADSFQTCPLGITDCHHSWCWCSMPQPTGRFH